jgi:hypothetical protein
MNRTLAILIFALAFCFAEKVVFAQRIPIPRPSPRFTATITGTVRLIDCNASPANVRIEIGRRTVQPRPVEGNDFLWSYTFSGVDVGTHTVRPVMAIGRCRRGEWLPATRTVTVESTLSNVRDVNFEYRGARTVTRINASLLAAVIEGAFRGTVIHLNNYSPRSHAVAGRDSWHVANDSFFTLPRALGGRNTNFDLLEVSRRPLRYYVRDMNLSRVAVRAGSDAFRLIFSFEDRGPTEIKGRCSNTTSSIDLACPAGSDSTAPDFEINNALLEVHLTPTRDASGNLTYGALRVTFEASVEGGGAGGIFEEEVERSIKRTVEDIVTRRLDQRGLRDAVAGALRPELNRRGIGTIIAVRFEGGDLVIDSYPR